MESNEEQREGKDYERNESAKIGSGQREDI